MLTIKGIKKFGYEAVGIFLVSKDDLIVEKRRGGYFVSFKNLKVSEQVVKKMWERRATGTQYAQVSFK